MGRNAAAVVREDVRSGIRSSWAERRAASTRDRPASICTMIDSDITMALSTSMPRAMISEARDIWLSPMSRNDITRNDSTMVVGMRLATTRPVRSPSMTSITSITMPTASSRLTTNSSTFPSTVRGWKFRTSRSTPTG